MATDADELDADIQLSLQQLHSLTDALDRRLQQRAEQQREFLPSEIYCSECSTSADSHPQTEAWPGLPGELGQPCNAGLYSSYIPQAAGSCTGRNTAATQQNLGADAGRTASTSSGLNVWEDQATDSHESSKVATANAQAVAELASASEWSVGSSNDINWDESLMALAGEQSTPSSVVGADLGAAARAACNPCSQNAVATAARQPKLAGWMNQMKQELKQESLVQEQAAQATAAAAAQRAADQRAAAWKQAQLVLPFQSGPSAITETRHKLHKTLSGMIRDAGPAAAEAAAAAAAALAAKTAADKAAAAATAAQAPAPTAAAEAGVVLVEGTAVNMSETQSSSSCGRALSIAHPAASTDTMAPELPVAVAADAASGLKGATQKPVRMSLLEMHVKEKQEEKQQQQQQQLQAAMVALISAAGKGTCSTPNNAAAPSHVAAGSCRSPSDRLPTVSRTQAAPVASASSPRCTVVRASRSGGIAGSPRTKAAVWAAADAATDAEVDRYLRDHWQQQHLPAAALVLQCAWRSRGPRLAFNRYMASRTKHAVSALGFSFSRWSHWTLAGRHRRAAAQRRAFMGWRELIQLQLSLCNKVVRALQKGVLAGDTAGLLMWRLCTPPDQHHVAVVRPSLGGLLGSILKQKEPQMRLQAIFAAWQEFCPMRKATRCKAHAHLSAAGRRWYQARMKDGLRFWLMYTVARRCEVLGIMLPVFRPRSLHFEEWLWQHERRQQLRQQAAGLFQKMCLRRFLGCWHGHCFKVRTMRAAWNGVVLHSASELLRGGMSAFKAHWNEMRLQWMLLGGCFAEWQVFAKTYKAVASMRRRIQQAADNRAKARTLNAFRQASHMSQLLSTAGVLRVWQSRPLVLAHVHAWLGDTLHMTLYLCWWRWKRKAVARIRLRAALGLHMYKAHWLDLELAFYAWRKAAAAARAAKPQEQPDALQLQRKYTGAAALVVICDDGDQPAIGMPATPPKLSDATALPGTPGAVVAAGLRNAPAGASYAPHGFQSGAKQPVDGAAGATPLEGSSPVVNAASGFALGVVAGCAGELLPSAAAAEPLQVEGQQGDELQGPQEDLDEDQQVFVSLADYPTVMPWRPLARRGDVMANQGLQHMSGARLAKGVRDLQELEGVYIVKDHDSGSEGLLGSIVFARRTVSPGLQAMVTAQLPMDVLWRFQCPEDCSWWQRIVGLVQQRVPHPDSWRCLMSSYNSTSSNITLGRKPSELHEVLHSSCSRVAASPSSKVCCTMQKTPGFRSSTTGTADSPKSQNICSNSKSGMRPVGLTQLQLPGVADSARPRSVRAHHKTTVVTAGRQITDSPAPHFAAGNSSISSNSSSTSAATSGRRDADTDAEAAAWPECWTHDDIAWICQLAQAEELLETAVHLLLGIGADSSEELYQKLRQMTRGQDLSYQGDLLAWLLSTAIAHDTAQTRKVLLRARARDELLNATMELRERARALHLHFPLKFTLSTAGTVVDTRAMWAAVISRVEVERDWDASSTDESDYDPRSIMWLSLMQQQSANDAELASARRWALDQSQPDQQQRQQRQEGQGTWEYVSAEAIEQLEPQPSITTGLSRSQLVTPRDAAEQAACAEPQQMPSSMSQLSLVSAGTATTMAIAAAAAVAGPEFRSPSLSPGGMLSQRMGSGELQPYHASRTSTPAGNMRLQPQQQEIPIREQDLMAEQKGKRRKLRAEQRQQQKQQASMTAAVGLFGGATAHNTMQPAAAGADNASGFTIDYEIFAGPPAFGLGSALNSARSSIAASEMVTPRVTGAGSSRVSSAAAAAAAGRASDRLVGQGVLTLKPAAAAAPPAAAVRPTSAAGVSSLPAVQQQQRRQSQSGQGWRAFAFNPSASTTSASSAGAMQQSSRAFAITASQPPAEVALMDGRSTLHNTQTTQMSAFKPSSSRSSSRASIITKAAEQEAHSRPGSGSSSIYRMSSSNSSRPFSSSSDRQDSSSRPGSSTSKPLSAKRQPQDMLVLQTDYEAHEKSQKAIRTGVAVAQTAADAAGPCVTGSGGAPLATKSNNSQLLHELKGVLAGVLAPAEGADSPAAAAAREAAGSLAGACASWLEQQQQKDACDFNAAGIPEQASQLGRAASGRRPDSGQQVLGQQQMRQHQPQQKQQLLGRPSSSSPDVGSSLCLRIAQPAAATSTAVPRKSASNAAQAVPSLALGSLSSAHSDCSTSISPEHSSEPCHAVVARLQPASKPWSASREQQSTRSSECMPPAAAAAAAAAAITTSRQGDAAVTSAGLTVMSYCKPVSAGSGEAGPSMPDSGSDGDDAVYMYHAGGLNPMLEHRQEPPAQSQELMWQNNKKRAVLTTVAQELRPSSVDSNTGQCQQQQQQQQQRWLQQQESNCSTLSSLPSIPSCSDVMMDSMQQWSHSKHAREKKQQECELPAITAGRSSSKQQPMTALTQQQQQLSQVGSRQLPKLHAETAAATSAAAAAAVPVTLNCHAEHKAVWHAPAPAAAKHGAADVSLDELLLHQPRAPAGSSTAVQPQAGGVSALLGLDAPPLHDLLQEAAKDDWNQFEALASELASQLSAALQASQAAATAPRQAQRLPKLVLTNGAPDARQQQQQWQGRQQQQQQQTIWPAAAGELSAASMLDYNMQWGPAALAAAAAGGGVTAAGPELNSVLAKLVTAPLAARFVFWKQMVTKQQQQQLQPTQQPWDSGPCSSNTRIAAQLHQLAWSSLLQRPAVTRLRTGGQAAAVPIWSPDAAAVTHAACEPLRAKLQQYMQAHVQWRQQQVVSQPLMPAEKWQTLEHEEQVLDFITCLTISVYSDSLRKHRSVRAVTAVTAAKQASTPAAFGTSSARIGASVAGPTGANCTATAAAAVAATGVAHGQALTAAKKASPAVPRETKRKAGQVFVIPGPSNAAALWQQHTKTAPSPTGKSARNSAAGQGGNPAGSSHRISAGLGTAPLRGSAADAAGLDVDCLEALQGWQSATGTPATGDRPVPGSSRSKTAGSRSRSSGAGTERGGFADIPGVQHYRSEVQARLAPMEKPQGHEASCNSVVDASIASLAVETEESRVSCCSSASSWQMQN